MDRRTDRQDRQEGGETDRDRDAAMIRTDWSNGFYGVTFLNA